MTCEIAKYESLQALDSKSGELESIRDDAQGNSQQFVEKAARLVSGQDAARLAASVPEAPGLIAALSADAASNEQNVAQLAAEMIGLVNGRHVSLGLATLRIRSAVVDDIAAKLPSGEDLLTNQEANVLAQMRRLGVGGLGQSRQVQRALDASKAPPLDRLNALIANYRAVLASPECSTSTS